MLRGFRVGRCQHSRTRFGILQMSVKKLNPPDVGRIVRQGSRVSRVSAPLENHTILCGFLNVRQGSRVSRVSARESNFRFVLWNETEVCGKVAE